jgi:shikimate kinase
MKIILVGFMGCGKTTIGKKLARQLHCSFIDTDSYFEKLNNISIYNYFTTHGEAKFREDEKKVLTRILEGKDNAVISTGGGTPCFYDNMELINRNGTSVYLKMSVQSLTIRLLYSYKKRPLIEDFKEEYELRNYIEKTLNEREPFYNKAHHAVKGENLNLTDLLGLLNDSSSKPASL